MIPLKVKDLNYKIDEINILKNISFQLNEGEFVGIVGPNGCGKSTLLKNIYRVYTPYTGSIFLSEENIVKLTNKVIAKKMGVVSQENDLSFDFNVMDMVMMGRFSHKELFQGETKNDIEIVENCLNKVGMLKFKDRSFLSLSGGEKQRVLIARALAQEAKILILDEPTNHLDIGYQIQIMDIVKKQNLTIFSAIHDLNIAASYCDKIFLMHFGEIIDFGTPEEVLNKENIEKLFRVKVAIEKNKYTNKLNIIYISSL